MHNLVKPFRLLLDLIIPARCAISGTVVEHSVGLSPDAFKDIQFITAPYCKKCGAPLKFINQECGLCYKEKFHFDEARSVFLYSETSKKLILQYKHGDRLSLTPLFARWLYQYGSDILDTADYLIPVPLHPTRLRHRLYNQAAELCKGLSKLSKTPVLLDALVRTRNTLSQGHENREARIRNMKDAFEINPKTKEKLKDKHIILMDDVMTTGATVNACAEILKKATPKKISILTLAKVIGTVAGVVEISERDILK